MKYRYFLLCCFLLVFVFAMFFVCAFFTEPIENLHFFDEKCKLSLNLYFDKTDGVHYLFVPSHESSGDISVNYPLSMKVLLDGEALPSGSVLDLEIGGGGIAFLRFHFPFVQYFEKKVISFAFVAARA